MKRVTVAIVGCVVVGAALATGLEAAESGLPVNSDAMLTIGKGTWFADKPDERQDVALRLRRLNGNWVPVFSGATVKGANASHMGFVTASQSGSDGESLTLRVHLQADPWIGGEADAGYKVRFAVAGGQCQGTWTGVVHGVGCGGSVSGVVETVQGDAGFKPPQPGEHPRLLIRKADLPALRAKAETPWGQDMLQQLKADKGILAQAFVYALTGDKAVVSGVQEKILKSIDNREWFHIGIAHAAAYIAAEHLMAYDLIYDACDACDASFHRRIRDCLADKLDFYYWGAQNTQFNPQDTSNWSLMYRSGLGLMAMTAMDYPPEAPPIPPKEFPRLKPPADLKPGAGVSVVPLSLEKPLDAWIFAGPVTEGLNDDALREVGGVAGARPEVGTKAGDCVFQSVGETNIVNGNVNLATLTKRMSLRGCYLYCVLEVGRAGYYRLESMSALAKGVRHRVFYLNGHRMESGDAVYLETGKYPLMARIFTEPVGGWEPLGFWANLALTSEQKAMTWYAVKSGGPAADAFCGDRWRLDLYRATGWNSEAWGYAQMAALKVERYCMLGLGEHGWNQEGEAYTRHAVHLAMPFAYGYRNMFGADIRGADRMGQILALATAQTVFSDSGARMQSFNVGGGPMDLSLFARGYSFVPADVKPAVLWAWNRTAVLAKAGKLNDPHGVVGAYDGISKAMAFLNYPVEEKEQNPETVMPRVTVDRQKGGFVFRNRWKDGDDCVAQLFANSNQAGGSWASCEGGTFRIDGLGASWAVRGQGYGHGASGRNLPDYSLYQNMVDVGEQNIGGSPQAKVMQSAVEQDGSGTVSLNMDEIYLHFPKEKSEKPGKGGATVTEWKADKPVDIGIRAVRGFGVDYSGTCGAPCLVAVGDHLTGTQGSNVWQLATGRENTVTCTNGQFVITAPNGATLMGTVVRPAGAQVRTVDYEHIHEINYHGSHKRSPFLRRAILVDGKDKEQEFLVLMTIQKGDAPAVEVLEGGASALVGKRKVSFDGKQIVLGTP